MNIRDMDEIIEDECNMCAHAFAGSAERVIRAGVPICQTCAADSIGAVRNAARAHRDLSWVACEAEPHMEILMGKLWAEEIGTTEEIIGELLRQAAVYLATMCGRCGEVATVRAVMDPPMPTPTLYRRCDECLPALWRMAERAGRSLILTSL